METKYPFYLSGEKNTLAIHFSQYISECRYCAHLSVVTIQGYEAVFFLFLKLMPEVTGLELLDPGMLVEFFRRLATRERIVGAGIAKQGVQESTIKTYWGKLNAFFNWLLSKSLIAQNPLSSMEAPQPRFQDKRELSDVDIRKVYSAIALYSTNNFALRRDTAMVSLLVFTGMRAGEFISLEVRDLDLEKRTICVRSETSKSKRIRYIPIHPTLLLHLREYISERNKRRYRTHFLIAASNGDRGLSRHGLKHWVHILGKKAGLKFHLHQFRHAFACNLARKNVHAIKIQRLLGHSNLNMTMSYLRSMVTDDLQHEINQLNI